MMRQLCQQCKKGGFEFRIGVQSHADDPRTWRRVTLTIKENIDRVHHMVMDDRILTINK